MSAAAEKSRAAALDKIAALAEAHGLTAEDIAARFASGALTPQAQGGILKQVLGYIGGAFVFSGLCLFSGMIWGDISGLQRVLLTLGTGIVAFILGFLSLRDTRFDRAATPFFLIAALLQTGGLFVFLAEFMPPSGDAELAALSIFSVMGLQQALAFAATRRTSLAFTAIFFWIAALSTGLDLLGVPVRGIQAVCGLSLLCLARALDRTSHRGLSPFAYYFGASSLLSAAWSEAHDNLLFLALDIFLVYFSVRAASRTLLAVGVIGLLGYLGDFTFKYFADTKLFPLALIVMGLIMIGLSSYAIRLGQKIAGKRG
jgi:hypothetical protein